MLKENRSIFSPMMFIVAESRKVRMNDVLVHPLGPMPWTMANADDPYEKKHTTCIIDGMSVVQKLKGKKNICTDGRVCIIHGVVCRWIH